MWNTDAAGASASTRTSTDLVHADAHTSQARVNGVVLRGILSFVKDSDLPGGVHAFLAALPDEHKSHFVMPVLRGTWYPYPVYGAVLEQLEQSLGSDVDPAAARAGRFLARRDGSGGLKLLSLVTRVEQTMPWAASLWPRYCDQGTFETIVKENGFAHNRLTGFPGIHPLHCELLRNWFAEMCLVLRADTSSAEHTKCVHRGDDCCEYQIRWS